VAHGLLRAVSRLPKDPQAGFSTPSPLAAGRRQEWRRGTHECVRHTKGCLALTPKML